MISYPQVCQLIERYLLVTHLTQLWEIYLMWKLVELQVCSELGKNFLQNRPNKDNPPVATLWNWRVKPIWSKLAPLVNLCRSWWLLPVVSKKKKGQIEEDFKQKKSVARHWDWFSCWNWNRLKGSNILCWTAVASLKTSILFVRFSGTNTKNHKIHFAKIDNIKWWNMIHFDLNRCWLCRSKSHFFCQYCGASIHQNMLIRFKSPNKI